MVQIESYSNHLTKRLNAIEEKMMALLDLSTIKKFENDPNSIVFSISPPHYFADSDEKQTRMQAELAEMFSEWIEHIHLLTQNLPSNKKQDLEQLESLVFKWIDRSGGLWGLPATIDEAKKMFSTEIENYRELLRLLIGENSEDYVFIPDTNALIDVPDITAYKKYLGNVPYSVIITPTVTSELDKLKIIHRDEKFRDKVNSVIKRIKGWRNQGNLSQGVIVDKTITLKSIANEPDFNNTLSWLDKNNEDDRLVASALEVQRKNIKSKIVLVTSDINLQNKAELANFPYMETPDS
jgi:rRNA-processing protein FCF1